ncbi:MAG: hypothetical protein AB7F88_17770 [Pyrinomonadaceae bacterium]
MLKRFLFATTLIVGLAFAVTAQSVQITSKKTVYTRPKPIADFKKTFTVAYPKVKASTPAMSRKIESTISYRKVLNLDVNEEVTEYQWLEEAGYEVNYNTRGILVITLSMSGVGAYPDETSRTVVVDLRNGERITSADAFANLNGLVAIIKKKQRAEIEAAIAELKKDSDINENDPAQLFADKEFTAKDLDEFAIDDDGVTFIYDYGFPHAIEALQPEGRYKFNWSEIAKFVKLSGPFAQFVSK